MPRQRIHDDELHAHFVTFSCYRRRRLLDHDRPKKIVLGVLNSQLSKQKGKCTGFVVMPDHVHAIIWFPQPGQLSHFMKQWKQRSSVQIKRFLWDHLPRMAARIPRSEPIWQRKFYPFNIYSQIKLHEKVEYMHLNPVRAGLVAKATDWPWSSARYYEKKQTVGVAIQWVE